MDTLRITGKQQWACDNGTVAFRKTDGDSEYWYVVERPDGGFHLCETLDAAMVILGCDKVEITPEQAREYRPLGARE